MRYLALLYGSESEAPEPGSEAFAESLRGYERFEEHEGEAIVAGEALEPVATAVTVRPDAGGVMVTDGPFAETTEVVGGVYVLEADDLDAAIELARQIPAAHEGAVELRPLVEWFDRASAPDAASIATRYLALLYEVPSDADVPGTAAWDRGTEAHARFGEEVGDALFAGGALHPAEAATTVRVRDGELMVTDGCYAETTEVIGGLYGFSAITRDEAVAVARRIPVGPGGGVEVRPILEIAG